MSNSNDGTLNTDRVSDTNLPPPIRPSFIHSDVRQLVHIPKRPICGLTSNADPTL